jgi:enterochelin esterase-like enzyme
MKKTPLLPLAAASAVLVAGFSLRAAEPAGTSAPGLHQTTDRAGVVHLRGGPATPADLAELAKLKQLPPLTPGAGDGDYLLPLPHDPAPEGSPRPDVPHGRIVDFKINAAESKFYPGTGMRGATATRDVRVYIPAQYVPGTPAPLLVSQDAMAAHNSTLLPTMLDNMIADGRLPVMVAVFARSGGGDDRGSERGLEYDTLSGKFGDFLEDELLPRVARECNVTFTKDPDARCTIGGSAGGNAAFTMAWFHPDRFHRVLTYTATFTNNQWPENPALPHGAWEYAEHLIPQNPAKPIRVWLEVNENDMGADTSAADMHNLVIANQRMAAALKAKGYHYQFVYALGAGGPYAAGQGHDDAKVIAETLPRALEYLWKDYRPKK